MAPIRRRSPSAAAVFASAFALSFGAASAYWSHASCASGVGATGELCVSPWLKEDPKTVFRWALKPDLCVAAAGDGSFFTLFVLQNCSISYSGSSDAIRLLTASSATASASEPEDSAHEAKSTLAFRAPPSGYGAVHSSNDEGKCLAVVMPQTGSSSNVSAGTVVELRPCAAENSDDAQTFIATPAAASPSSSSSSFVGVNLGGWLIMEDWMWPGMMEAKGVTDEYTFIQDRGGPTSPAAVEAMQSHWDTFLRPEHLDTLRRFGVTHVRIPIGYWLLHEVYQTSDGFVSGSEAHLARALGWLKERGMLAVLDLHAMPGAQATDEGFTGREVAIASFFTQAPDWNRGRLAVEALASLVSEYEARPETSGVVVGIQLLNEPNDLFLNDTMKFYQEMVPKVRAQLPADRFLIMLSFMDSPHTASAEWFAKMREADPKNFAGVVYDIHLYHLFGDNQAPWSEDQDTCKTCCRDAHMLDPMVSRGIPTIVGEYSMSTGFGGAVEFGQENLLNQLSLWNTTDFVVGSFLWNFRILLDPGNPEDKLEWSLVDMIAQNHLPADFMQKADRSSLCPALEQHTLAQCPSFENVTVIFDTVCSWKPASASPSRRLRGSQLV